MSYFFGTSSAASFLGSKSGTYVKAASVIGSLDFVNGQSNFIIVPNSTNFAPGTGDFTVEWWQYVDSIPQYQRIFSIGTYATGITLGVATQSGTMYFWIQSSNNGVGSSLGSYGTIIGSWNHFALVRNSGNVKLYKNGSNLSGAGVSNTNNATYNEAKYFVIGSESADGAASTIPGSTEFDGRLSQFRFVNGTALYTANFTPSTRLTVVPNTKLLLLAGSSATYLKDSALNATITKVGTVNWSASKPT